jgi:hypothetical protein
VAHRSGRVDELRRQGLDAAIDHHVIDDYSALSEQLLDIAMKQAAGRYQRTADSNHLAPEAVASWSK